MAIKSYDLGTEIQLSGFFTDVDGVTAKDPDTIVVKVKDPSNNIVTYSLPTVQRTALGTYTLNILPTASGPWWYRFEGTGACQAAAEQQFTVKPSHF